MEFRYFARKCLPILPYIEESNSCQKKSFSVMFLNMQRGENCVSLGDLCESGKLQLG